jgi:hypothetical protein
VFESAVCTWLIFGSSARAAEARLTTPTAAKPNVNLLNFIWFLRCCFVLFVNVSLVSRFTRLKANPRLPRHHAVQLTMKIGKSGGFDNIFFHKTKGAMLRRNIFTINTLRPRLVFARFPDGQSGPSVADFRGIFE